MTRGRSYCPVALLLAGLSLPAGAADWPQWRCTAERSGVTGERLEPRLHLQWTRHLPVLKPAWPREPRLQFDGIYRPVVMGSTMVLGSSRDDSVAAFDIATGAEKWVFWTDGPVRFAPACAGGKVYAVSDDGYLYCLDAETGGLLWRVRGGPAERKLIGNERIISAWPARGGPVVADGTVYFAAGIWPFMGVFVHAVNAETGQTVWTNGDSHCLYRVIDHNFWDYAGVSPQGYLVVAGAQLIVPCGRAWPAWFDRETGKLLHFAQGQELTTTQGRNWQQRSWREGSWRVAASSRWVLNAVLHGGRGWGGVLDARTGGLKHLLNDVGLPPHLALDQDTIYGVQAKLCAVNGTDFRMVWELPVAGNTLVKAGTRLYVGATGRITAVDLPPDGGAPKVSWETPVEGSVRELLAAAGRLVAVTDTGRVYCFGPTEGEPTRYALETAERPPIDGSSVELGARVLQQAGAKDGYAFVLGSAGSRLAEALAQQSDLRVVLADADGKSLRQLRSRLQGSGWYGHRLSAFQCEPLSAGTPPYVAALIVVPDAALLERLLRAPAGNILNSLHPYGGVFCARVPAGKRDAFTQWVKASEAELGSLVVSTSADLTLIRRQGPLPGAGVWTHEYADAARTLCADDRRVRPPFAVLWFGGPTDGLFAQPFFIPRYYPSPLVLGGRLLAQSLTALHAADVYTGRLLWQAPLPKPDDAFDTVRLRTPGYTSVAVEDAIYVACGETCLCFDPDTGKQRSEYRLSGAGRAGEKPYWGYISVWQDLLLATRAMPSRFWDRKYEAVTESDLTAAEMTKLVDWVRALRLGGAVETREGESTQELFERIVTEILTTKTVPDHFPKELRDVLGKRLQLRLNTNDRLVVMDRHTGEVRWERDARLAFTHVNNQLGNPRLEAIAVGGGKVFCLDTLPPDVWSLLKRRGREPNVQPTLTALDVRTGQELWRTSQNLSGQLWVCYSGKHDVVLTGVYGSIHAFRGADGAQLWTKAVPNQRAPIVHDDALITMLIKGDLTGKSIHDHYDCMYRAWTLHDLLTGEEKGHFEAPGGYCGFASAARNLVLFRGTSAAYYDLAAPGVTSLPGFRTGCAMSLVPADGVISVPNYQYHCACNYPIFTALALVHDPDVAKWVTLPVQDQRLSKRAE